ncbi:hypothetical protein H6G80_16390 [Nostoc sp. FACHB-87]|uniref:hypothetical protein n=1 Tax=Nostocaceae TaxID=1162 RepID=UPI0016890DC0|nr:MULTISPECIES: hypothetical protein [Nostocaceae]MBD2455654.1 hypothetical protein [Nostoc sp. FACHB-87]MBD2477285.1 hypothetical protein [Anabaena sp. FACHB-83]
MSISIGDKDISEQDNRMTPEQFIQIFDLYVNRHASGHQNFYPVSTEFEFSGIKDLLSEIRAYGLTKCQNEIYELLLEQYKSARNGYFSLSLDHLKKEIQSIFRLHHA